MLQKNVRIMDLIIALAGVFAVLYGIILFNQYVIRGLPIPIRVVVMVVIQWTMFLVPGILMFVRKETFRDLGLTTKQVGKQIIIGVGLALAMSLVLTVIPILLGFKEYVGSTSYQYAWQFAVEFVYAIFGVALVEELIFRGYVFNKLLQIRNNRWYAILLSSVIFGVFHVFNGNIIQLIVTTSIGILLCLFREKIKGCTLLSLIVAHGMHNALIVLFVWLL